MRLYQIYLIDRDRRLHLGERFSCDDDERAIRRLTAAEVGEGGAELWQGGRPVAQAASDGILSVGIPGR